MAYRASYGADLYGTELYGVTGAIDAAATITPALSVSCSSVTVVSGSAAISASLTALVTDDIVKDGSATITLQSATVSVAEEYTETEGFRPGYGLRTYGSSIYGQNNSTEVGTANIAIAASMSASAGRTRNVSAAISATATLSVSSVYTVIGTTNLSLGRLNIDAAVQRLLLGSSTSTIALTIATAAQEKWEPVAPTSEIWTPITWSRAA